MVTGVSDVRASVVFALQFVETDSTSLEKELTAQRHKKWKTAFIKSTAFIRHKNQCI